MQLKIFRDNRQIGWVFLWTFIFGMAAHGFVYLNSLFSHDSMMIVTSDADWQISIGRFLNPVYFFFRGNVNAPWLIGLLSLLWIALALCLIIRMLDIISRLSIVIICGVFSTNLCLICLNASYLYIADLFMFSFLMASAGAFLWERYRFGFLPGAALIAASMALYQAFAGAAVGLVLLALIKKLLCTVPVKKLVFTTLKALGMLVLGAVIYILSLKLVLALTHIPLSDSYNGIAGAGDFAGVSIPALLLGTYTHIAGFFFGSNGYNVVPVIIANAALGLLAVAALIYVMIIQKLKALHFILAAVAVVLLPFGVNLVYFISKGLIHELMTFPYFLVYLFAVQMLDLYDGEATPALPDRTGKFDGRKWIRVLTPCFFVLILLNNIIFANGAYLKKQLEYNATLSSMTRVADRMESTQGYRPNETPVALVGSLDTTYLNAPREGFERYSEFLGLGYNVSVTYYLTDYHYFQYVLGMPVKLLSEDESAGYAQRQEVIDMPAFPTDGFCQMVDDVLVVKLS